MSARVVSKLGIHRIGGQANGYGNFIQVIATAGRQLALHKSRDDFSGVQETVALWPDVVTVGAFTDYDRLPFDIMADWPKFLARAQANPLIRYWELLNEDDGHWSEKADLYCQLMPLFQAYHMGMCVFNCSSGQPPYYHETDGAEAYTHILRVARFARDNGFDVIVGVHGYGYDIVNCLLRYRALAQYLSTQGAPMRFALTEFGDEEAGFRGVDKFLDWCETIDAELMHDDYLIGVALWTLGGGWNDFSPALWNAKHEVSALGEYIAHVQPPSPPSPPPEPPDDGIPLPPLHVRLNRGPGVSVAYELDPRLASGRVVVRYAPDVVVGRIDE